MIDPRKLLIDYLSEIRAMIVIVKKNGCEGLAEMRRRENIYIIAINQLNTVFPDSYKFQPIDIRISDIEKRLEKLEYLVSVYFEIQEGSLFEKTTNRKHIEAVRVFCFLSKAFEIKIDSNYVANYSGKKVENVNRSIKKAINLFDVDTAMQSHVRRLKKEIKKTFKLAS